MTDFNLSSNEVNILTQVMRLPLHYDIDIEKLTIKEINIPHNEMKFTKGFIKEDVKEFIRLQLERLNHELEAIKVSLESEDCFIDHQRSLLFLKAQMEIDAGDKLI